MPKKRTVKSEAAEMKAIDPLGISEPYPTTDELKAMFPGQFPLLKPSGYTRRPMKKVTAHRAGDKFNNSLQITPLGRRSKGGAYNEYRISGVIKGVWHFEPVYLEFQKGDPNKDLNGISNEALLAVVADRLSDFQAGPFACTENAAALYMVQQALAWLQKRTKERLARGVSGKATP